MVDLLRLPVTGNLHTSRYAKGTVAEDCSRIAALNYFNIMQKRI